MKDQAFAKQDRRSDIKFRFYVASAAGAAFLLLGAVAAAPALSAGEALEGAQEERVAQAEYSQEQLESFAVASLRVQEVNEKWMERIAEAESAEKSEELRDQAIEEMTGAVRNEGLDVETYNRIYDAVERNPEIASVVEDYRREHSE